MSGQRHVLFDAGGLALAVPADAVQAIHDDLPPQRVSGTRGWFLGLAVADGRLLPVTDLAAWLGRRSAAGRTLHLHPDVGIAGLRVDTVHGLSGAAAEIVVQPMSSDAPPTSPVSVEAPSGAAPETVLSARVVIDNAREHRIVDLAALLQHPRFLDISSERS